MLKRLLTVVVPVVLLAVLLLAPSPLVESGGVNYFPGVKATTSKGITSAGVINSNVGVWSPEFDGGSAWLTGIVRVPTLDAGNVVATNVATNDVQVQFNLDVGTGAPGSGAIDGAGATVNVLSVTTNAAYGAAALNLQNGSYVKSNGTALFDYNSDAGYLDFLPPAHFLAYVAGQDAGFNNIDVVNNVGAGGALTVAGPVSAGGFDGGAGRFSAVNSVGTIIAGDEVTSGSAGYRTTGTNTWIASSYVADGGTAFRSAANMMQIDAGTHTEWRCLGSAGTEAVASLECDGRIRSRTTAVLGPIRIGSVNSITTYASVWMPTPFTVRYTSIRTASVAGAGTNNTIRISDGTNNCDAVFDCATDLNTSGNKMKVPTGTCIFPPNVFLTFSETAAGCTPDPNLSSIAAIGVNQ